MGGKIETVQSKLCSPISPDVIASPNTEEFGKAIVLFSFLFSRSLLIVLFLGDITHCYKQRTTLVQPEFIVCSRRILNSLLNINEDEFTISSKGTLSVLKALRITWNFCIKSKALQIQGKPGDALPDTLIAMVPSEQTERDDQIQDGVESDECNVSSNVYVRMLVQDWLLMNTIFFT